MFLHRFRDRKKPRLEIDLQDALYLVHIITNVIKRYGGNVEYRPDADDLFLINEIARTATDAASLAIETERTFHRRAGKVGEI